MHHNRRIPMRTLRTILLCVSGLLAVGCSDGGGSRLSAESWPGDGGPTAMVDLSYGYQMDVPADWGLSFGGLHSSGPPQATACEHLAAGVGPVGVLIVGRGCTAAHSAGNGDSGTYLSPDQALGATSIERHDLPSGELVTFVQPHYVCTNECQDEMESVALFTADEPADPDFPVVMFVRWTEEFPVERLVALGESVRVDGGWTEPRIQRLDLIDGVRILQERGATASTTSVSAARIDDDAGEECEVREARVARDTGFDVIGRGCTGSHGLDDFSVSAYLEVDQVEDAIDVEQISVPAGTLTMFDIAGCDDCTMGLLPLPVEASERYGGLQFSADRDTIRALAEAIVLEG